METSSNAQPVIEGTNVRQFLAQKGSIVIKELREVGKLKAEYDHSIIVSTMILGIVKGKTRKTSYGVRLSRTETESYSELSVLLDFDELPELMDSFDFIGSLSVSLKSKQCDYTEVVYSTKDDAQFGFYQTNQQDQQAFIKISPHGDTTFLDVGHFVKLKTLFLNAQEHLITRGASIE